MTRMPLCKETPLNKVVYSIHVFLFYKILYIFTAFVSNLMCQILLQKYK